MKNYVYVKHKANTPWPNFAAALYVWRKLLFKRKARRGQINKLSVPEIKEKIKEYRQRAKALSLNK